MFLFDRVTALRPRLGSHARSARPTVPLRAPANGCPPTERSAQLRAGQRGESAVGRAELGFKTPPYTLSFPFPDPSDANFYIELYGGEDFHKSLRLISLLHGDQTVLTSVGERALHGNS